MGTIRSIIIAAAASSALLATACGGGGDTGIGSDVSAGSGSISITSFSPNPLLGCGPTAFVLIGTGFQDVSGTTAIVKFTASIGGPFGGSATATVIGNVINATTITGITPEVSLCGVAPVSLTVDVTLESGVSTSSTGTGIVITLTPPSITTFLPASVPAAIPTAFTITGAGFTPGPVTVRFVSANLGDLNFQDGTSNSVDVVATATSSTNITGETPLARACTADFTSSVQLILPDGCCTAPTLPTFLTWVAPTLTAIGYGSLSAVVPTAIAVQGANLGVTGETGTVRLTQSSTTAFGLLFDNFSSQTIDLPAVVAAGGTLALVVIPPVSICASAGVVLPTSTASLRWIAPRGSSCADHPLGATATSFLVPPVSSITTPTVNALVPTAYSLVFAFAVANGVTPIRLEFTSTSGAPIFADGTSTTFESVGNFNSPFSAAGTTPTATLCGVDTAPVSITAYFAGGSCITSAPNLITYQRPSLATASPGGIQQPQLPVASFPNNNVFSLAGQEPFVLNALPGRSFGTVGAFVEVRFSTPGNSIWQGGARDFDTVVGQVASATTITGATPANVSQVATLIAVSVQALFEDGSCSDATTAQFVQTTNRTFALGTGGFFTINQAGAGAPVLIGAAVATPTTNNQTGLSVDGRKNLLAATYTSLFNTAQTMLGTPVVPTQIAAPIGGGTTADAAMAPDLNVYWSSSTGIPTLQVHVERTGSVLGFSPTPFTPGRLFYNQPSREMVVASAASGQIILFNAQTQTIDAIFAVPAIVNGVVVPLGTATWNGVTTIRPGTASARAYLVYDDPVVTNVDNLSTLSFATGVVTASVVTGINFTSAANPNALTYDGVRDQVVYWHATPGTIERRNATTLAIVLGAAIGTNVTSMSADSAFNLTAAPDDRFYLSDNSAGVVNAVNGLTLVSVGTVPVAVAGGSASTSP